jgi:hypothetical protein
MQRLVWCCFTFSRQSTKKDEETYTTLPLNELKKMYKTPEEKEFLQKRIVDCGGLIYSHVA